MLHPGQTACRTLHAIGLALIALCSMHQIGYATDTVMPLEKNPVTPKEALAVESLKAVSLDYGPNALDLNQDGVEDQVSRLWRENFNGEGYDIYQFMIQAPKAEPTFVEERDGLKREESLWHTVMIEDNTGGFFLPTVEDRQSGHCALRTVRLLRFTEGSKAPFLLAIGEKKTQQESFASGPIEIQFYSLSINEDQSAGRPLYSFSPFTTVVTEDSYCDSAKAIEATLGQLLTP